VLLQVLDEGRLTDNQGRTVNFKNTIIIMTSNIGASFIMERSKNINERNRDHVYGEIKDEIERLLKQHFRPEFLNRIDETVVFHPLSIEDIEKIVDLQFRQIQEKAQKQGIQLEITDEAIQLLAEIGYDPAFGARPLKRKMQSLITNPLSNRILAGDIKNGDHICIVVREKALDFISKTR
ncbi:AAA family ATPase, partial [bacterium]|nr:AAA family ATPase [bacterium]